MIFKTWLLLTILCVGSAAAAPFSAETHAVYPGDFNGDGKSDLMVIAKDPGALSGIYASNSSGQPSIELQQWNSSFLGINWDSGGYTAIIGNFDGVNGDDVLLQRNGSGTSFLLPTNSQGELYGIGQHITGWGTDVYRIVAGKFDANSRADVFLQSRFTSANSSVVLSDGSGHLTQTIQSWGNNHLGFKWSAANAIVHAGDFNGDGRDDLFLQSNGEMVLIDYDIAIPVPVFKPNSFGILLATPAGQFTSAQQIFSRKDFSVDFAPSEVDIVVGKFNGDGKADLLLLARRTGQPSFMVPTDGNNQLTGAGVVAIAAGTLGAELRTLAADFNGDGRSEVYRVASTAGGSNTIASFNSSGGLAANVAHSPPSAAVNATTAVGRTEGAWAVDDQGAATYSIPILAPPGTAGLTPKLGFVYSSNAGNGALGVGWSLSGLSRIERCPAVSASNAGAPREVRGDTGDRFCLDGNQLKHFGGAAYGQAGAEYRSEIDQFARIKSYGSAGTGPAHFFVEHKNGLIYEYGNTTDSRIEVLASANVRTWVVNKIRDRSGNAIVFNYNEDGVNGSFRISNVQYTSNADLGVVPVYQVSFVYEAMPSGEMDSSYVANGLTRRMTRLDRVDVTYNNSLIRRYELAFQPSLSSTSRSRLQSIQECAGPTLECLPATVFTYQNGSSGFAAGVTTGIASNGATAMDVNGDGRSDLVFTICNQSTKATSTKFSLANADGSYGPLQTSPYGYTGYGFFGCEGFLPIDYNADGREDIMFPDAGTGTWTIVLGSATGFAGVVNTSQPNGFTYHTAAADVTGDGLDDFVWFDGSYVRYRARELSGTFSATSYPLSTLISDALASIKSGRTALSRHGDFNGDGRADLLLEILPNSPALPTAIRILFGGTSPAELVIPNSLRARFADLNGDGLSDLVYSGPLFGGDGGLRYRFSRGPSMGPELATPSDDFLFFLELAVLDVDGDGFQDLVSYGPNYQDLYVRRSTGEGLQAPTLLASGAVTAIFAADSNGDGLADLGGATASGLTVFKHQGALPDLLSGVTDGFGVSVNFTYASTGNYSGYQRQNTATYPDQDTSGPLVVVSNVQASNGIGGSYALQQFSYEGARIGVTGRGFLGFAARSWVDSRTGVQQRSEYRQDFPLVGAVKLARNTRVSNNTTFSEVQTTYQTSISGGTGEQRYLVNASQVTSSERELNGAYNNSLVRTSTTTNTMDWNTGTVYDSVTVITEAASANGLNPGQSHTVRNLLPLASLVDDRPNWCIGRPQQAQQIVGHTLYGGTAQTRTANATWDTVKCRPTQTVIEPDNATFKVTTSLGYDSFGNLATQTVTPANETARVSQTNWGADGRFPRTLTNPLSQSTTADWWPDLGLLKSVTDPNGLVTSSTYDRFGRELTQVAPDGTSTRTEYLWCDADCVGYANTKTKTRTTLRDTASVSIARGFTLFDAFDRPRRSASHGLDGSLINQLVEYNDAGQVLRTSTPLFSSSGGPVWTSFSYDSIGRQTQTSRDRVSDTDASASTATIQYNGLSITSTDPQGKARVDALSAVGQILRATQASGTSDQTQTSYNYDPFGNLLRTTDPAGNQILVGYNIRGFKTSSSDPDLGNWTYDYYALGELKTQTDAKSQVTTFTYDKLSRPLMRVEPADTGSGNQTTTWTWGSSAASHNIGKLQSVVLGSYSETHAYDNRSRPASTTIVADGGTYTLSNAYDATTGLLDTVTYPASTGATPLKVRYHYDTTNNSGLVRRVTDFSTGIAFWEANASNAFGQYRDITLGNGLQKRTTYDSVTGVANRIETGTGGSSNRQSLQYLWDKVGNLVSRQDLNIAKTETFSYDNLYRLTQAAVTGAPALTVAYNAIGNITNKSDVGAYAYHATKKHAVATAGTYSFTYDANGNAITQNGATISWTAYNLPKLINQTGGNNSQFLYGPDRQRYKHVAVNGSSTETTIYIGGLLEKLTRGATVEYKHSILGPEGVVAIHNRKSTGVNETIYPLQDHLGSTDVVTDANGASLVKLSFTPFGARRNGGTWSGAPLAADLTALSNTTRRGFTEHEQLDNLNLIHMNGRVYHPVVGRFISADPFVQAPFNSQSLNRYSYVFNNPLSFTDPSGFVGDPNDGVGGIRLTFGSGYANPDLLGEALLRYYNLLTAFLNLGLVGPAVQTSNTTPASDRATSDNDSQLTVQAQTKAEKYQFASTASAVDEERSSVDDFFDGVGAGALAADDPGTYSFVYGRGFAFDAGQAAGFALVNSGKSRIPGARGSRSAGGARGVPASGAKQSKSGPPSGTSIRKPPGGDAGGGSRGGGDDSDGGRGDGLNRVRLQLQYGKNTIESTVRTNPNTIGVTKAQVYDGLQELYDKVQTIKDRGALASSKEFSAAIVGLSEKVKAAGPIRLEGNVLRTEFTFNGVMYRVDYENRNGTSLRQ
jgi:RHS repeat-associated protein